MPTSFKTILEKKTLPELKSLITEDMELVSETTSSNKYLALIKNKDSNRKLKLNIQESKLLVSIFDNTRVVENYSEPIKSTSDLHDKVRVAVETYKELDNFDDQNEDEPEILNEDEPNEYTSIEAGLISVKDKIQAVADEVKSISDMTNDAEMITIIMDIANNLYTTVLDTEDALETYKELKGIDEEGEDTPKGA